MQDDKNSIRPRGKLNIGQAPLPAIANDKESINARSAAADSWGEKDRNYEALISLVTVDLVIQSFFRLSHKPMRDQENASSKARAAGFDFRIFLFNFLPRSRRRNLAGDALLFFGGLSSASGLIV